MMAEQALHGLFPRSLLDLIISQLLLSPNSRWPLLFPEFARQAPTSGPLHSLVSPPEIPFSPIFTSRLAHIHQVFVQMSLLRNAYPTYQK